MGIVVKTRFSFLVVSHFQVDPAGGPVNGDQQITLLEIIGHWGQVFDVQVLEGFWLALPRAFKVTN